ncbi:uncharacterized protein [Nicotiana tomentosiformis]|uniref:uncharacterized protein n=1 Tax=Nicotiana tomentosiformis TaxID=4098 RepID=UPI00388C4871
MLAQIVASQNQRSNVAPTSSSQPGESTGSRVNRLLQLDPPVFTGTNPEEDPQHFSDEMYKTLRVMRATKTEAMELASYRLKEVAYSWFELWEESCGGKSTFRGESSGPSQSFAQSSAFAPASGPSQQQQWSRFRPSQGNRGSNQQGHHGEREQLYEPFSVSTLVGESILATRVYRDCVVTLRGRDTVADLIELRMVDFDVIMGMDWLYSCFAKLDCQTRTVRFEFLDEPIIEWKGDDVVPNGCESINGVAD